MEGGDLNLACAWALVDGLVGGGVRHACVAPGSRSTPLAVALWRQPAIEVTVLVDERSAGIVALGSALGASCVQAIGTTTGTFTTRQCEEFLRANPLCIESL